MSTGLLLLLPLLHGCGEAPVPAPRGARHGELLRWIGDDPSGRFDPRQAVDARTVGMARRVELGHTVRPARLARLGSPLAWPLDEGSGGELRFAVGLPPGMEIAPRIRVVDERTGEGRGLTLIDQLPDTDPTPPAGDPVEVGRWIELRAELPSAGAGRLVFEAWAEDGDPANENIFWGAPTLYPGNDAAKARASTQRMNVLFVSVDTWRADRLSLYGYERPTTPRLDRWARRRAVVFENAIAAAPWTLPSHVSMLSGVGPLGHRIHHDIGGQRGQGLPELLAERLRRGGWSSAAITGGAYLHPDFGFDRGFDAYTYWARRARSAKELHVGVDRALAWLAERPEGEPFFLFLHTYAAHDPYRARQPHFDRWAPEGLDWPGGASVALDSEPREAPEHRKHSFFKRRHDGHQERLELERDQALLDALYDSGLSYVDRQLARLLGGMDALGLRSDTLVVLTSDHGEALGDRGGDAGHETLYDHTLRVPLLIAFPDRRGAGERVGAAVRSIDIVPTILETLGLSGESERGEIDGRSLLPWIAGVVGDAGEPALSSGPAWAYAAAPNRGLALRLENRYKAILDTNAWRLGGKRRIELYDLELDPTETRDLLSGSRGEPVEIETWYRRFETVWEQEVEGLRLRLQNPGTGVLQGELEGEMLRPVATKSLDLDCSCLEWVASGEARFRLGPGDAFTLHFEKVFGRRLKVRGEWAAEGARHRFSETLRTDDPGGLAWDGEGWHPSRLDTLGESPGLALGWRGEPRYDEESSGDNQGLRRQLEALGYL